MKKPVDGETPTTGLEYFWLPICNRLRTSPEVGGPEVWFRVVHLAQVGHPCAPVATYREQAVEIAFGPKGAFENGNIGAFTRRALPNQLINTVPPGRGDSKPSQ